MLSKAEEFLPERGEIAALMRSKDWGRTPLGSMDSWPSSLKTILRLMLTSRYAMWLGWGPDLLFFYNDAYREQTLGTKHPASLARPFRDVWAEIWDDLAFRIERVISTGEATWDSGLLLFLERNGYSEETYHTFSYSPAPADTGGVGGLFCVVIEETERVLAERRAALLRELATALGPTKTTGAVLAALEQRLSKEARDIPFSLTYLIDDGGENARLVSRSGIPEDHPGAVPIVATADPAGAWNLGAVWSSLRPVEVPLATHVQWPHGPWRKPPTHAWIVPIAQAGQVRPAGAFVAALNPHRVFDDTYRSFVELFVGQLSAGLANARAYETEKKQAEALAQLDRAKTAFFSNVSHEFRTPLTLMLGPTEDALQSDDRALRGEALEIVHRNELRLLKLVNALLDFSRMEAGRVQASYVPTDLSQLTADLASAFRSAMERGGLRYEVECAPLAAPFYVDRDMWEKIVLNLLSNALKFTLKGFVRVTLRQAGDKAELEVRDSGPGVSPSELPHMFERFHRIEGTPARTHEGSGIGLALVRDLVELHGGSIRIESELGCGTAFIVSIPQGAAHLPSEHVHSPPAAPAPNASRATTYVAEALRWVPEPEHIHDGEGRASSDATVSAGARILVADDNADMREYIARLLRNHWVVDVVSDGKTALEVALERPPDVVLSDVMMPHIDGFELVRRLRENPSTRMIPVILLSARAGEEATGEGLLAGANDYIVKPFSARELVARVSSQLTIASVRKQAEAEKEAQRRVVESLFMNAPAGIALIRGERMIVEFANTMALEIWGKPPDVVGRPFLEALPELRGKGFDDLVREVIRTKTAFVGDEVPVAFQRGGKEQTLYLEFVYAPAENLDGVVDGVAAFGFDVTPQVTARKHAMLAATVGRAFVSNEPLAVQLTRCCEALVENGAVCARVWTFNSGHEVLELQAGAGPAPRGADADRRVALTAAGVGSIARATSPQLATDVDPELADPEWVRRERVISVAGYPLRVGERLVGALVVFSQAEPTASTLETLSGVSHQIALGIDRDLSERFRDLFIGMLGHDLRNPLNAVNVGTHLLEGVASLSATERKAVARIRNSASRMTRMIAQVLDFTRVRAAGGIPLDRKPSDLKAICTQVLDELAVGNPDGVIDAAYLGDTAGMWDADRLAQVFSNLVGNALAHGRRDTPIRVVVDGSGPAVVCSVHNLGRPIPAGLLPTLFDPFRRAVHGKNTGTAGLGLGLFITQHIVRAHGGTVDVQSSELDGTRFAFELPRASEPSA